MRHDGAVSLNRNPVSWSSESVLLVLKRPDIPLHNNLSERDNREYVIKRKISGSTRSCEGRRCRYTFASLKKTCKKQGIAFWDYLEDRVNLKNTIPTCQISSLERIQSHGNCTGVFEKLRISVVTY